MKLTAVAKTLCKDKPHYVFISQMENSSTLFPRKETNERRKESNVKIKEEEAKDTKPNCSPKKSLYQNLPFWTPTRNQTREAVAVGPGLGPRSLSDSFFFPLIASIKSSTGTKGISTISDRNRKACFFCTFSIPIQWQISKVLSNKHVSRLHNPLKCIDFGFSQDNT